MNKTSYQENKPVSKKEKILSLFKEGQQDISKLAKLAFTKESYVASVLQNENLIAGYFDLYTPSANLMNIHARFFAYRLGFKNEEIAKKSVAAIHRAYKRFERTADRAGQHHALMVALLMFNRARWTNKLKEAEVFRQWLLDRLAEAR